jgi:hypothetical protein
MIAKLIVTDTLGVTRTFTGSHDHLRWLYERFMKDESRYGAIDMYDENDNVLYEKLLISHAYTTDRSESSIVVASSEAQFLLNKLYLER